MKLITNIISERKLKVSIITVVYNGAKTIEQTILSVLGQTYKNIEYIIIDGLSTDGTQEIVKKYQESISVFISEKDNGMYDAMNKGIRMATGDVIGIINSDDWYSCNAVENVVRCFIQRDVDIVYGKLAIICTDGREVVRSKEPLENIAYGMAVPHPTVFITKRVYEKFGDFDLSYKLAADYELLLRLYHKNLKFEYIDQIIAYFRMGGASTKQILRIDEETRDISMKYIGYYIDTKGTLEKIEERFRWNYFIQSIKNGDILIKVLESYFQNEKFNLVIFGTGVWGKRCYEMLKGSKITVSFFVDNNSLKWKQELYGVKILNPNKLKDMKAYILIAVMGCENEIVKQLDMLKNKSLKYVTFKELEVQFYESE